MADALLPEQGERLWDPRARPGVFPAGYIIQLPHAARFETLNRCLIYVPAHAFVRLLLEVVQGLTTDGSLRAAGCCKHV